MNLVVTLKKIIDHGSAFNVGLLNNLPLATVFTDMRRLTAFSFSETVTVLCRFI